MTAARKKREADSRAATITILEAALETVANGLFITDLEGTILWVNAEFTRITGYAKPNIVGQPASVLAGQHDAANWESIWTQVRGGQNWRGETAIQDQGGQLITVQQTLTAIAQGESPTHVVVSLDDVTARKQAESQKLNLAQRDSLTGLPNRSLFSERLNQSMDLARRQDGQIALLLLDLNEFKETNYTMGHRVGDSLLVAVARRLEGKLAPGGILGRLSGDEFAILVENVTSREMLADHARDILSALNEPFLLHDHALRTTASLGIAVYPADGSSPEDLFRQADIAMYQAKKSARNAYHFYDTETDKETAGRVLMVRELRSAFQNGGLRVAFQQQVDLASGEVIAAEALIRWTHETLGEVSPAQLIPAAEASGLIHELGDWVLTEVCLQINRWREKGLRVVPVAVNLSAMQLAEERTVEHLLEPLRRHGVEASLLMMEITESVLLRHSDRVRTALNELHNAGVALVLDDFGTGYSSLTYLRQYPVSCIKLDVSFVQGVGTNTSDEEIISAMLSLAHALRMKVVAEGVETASQAEFLRNRGCDAAQGYYFGKPVPASEFEILLEKPGSESDSE